VIEAWRLVKLKRASYAFTGEGARLYGGRWNHPGTKMGYVSGSLALAALEAFVHLTGVEASIEYSAIPVQIPEELVHAPLTLPKDWRQEPPPCSAKDFGTEWAKKGMSAVLEVPSVIVPVEYNYVLNPAHPEFGKITIAVPEAFSFDPRMWK